MTEQMGEYARGWSFAWAVTALAVIVSTSLAPTMLQGPGLVMAGQNGQPMSIVSIAYQVGIITAVYEKTFQIDGKTYSLAPDAIVVDDSGSIADASALAVGIEVKYHLKKDKSDLIDNMILFLPR